MIKPYTLNTPGLYLCVATRQLYAPADVQRSERHDSVLRCPYCQARHVYDRETKAPVLVIAPA